MQTDMKIADLEEIRELFNTKVGHFRIRVPDGYSRDLRIYSI